MSADCRPVAQLIDLAGRVAIVTGAGQGLGLFIALRLAEVGAAVIAFDLDEAGATSAAEEISAQGGTAAAVAGDVANPADVERLVATAVDSFGRLDILVNNAGIYPQVPFLASDSGLWETIFRVNVSGTMLCSQVTARRLIAQGDGGAIVNIASVAGLRPAPDAVAAYGASKAAVMNFTQVLALSLAPHRIRVNAIAPGGIETPGVAQADRRPASDIPLGRRAHPDEVARAALFLASDLASYMTGATLVVDGGYQLA